MVYGRRCHGWENTCAVHPSWNTLAPRSRFGVQAYAAQVLTRAEQASLADLRSLFDYQRGNAGFLGLIQLGLALEAGGDSGRGERALTAGLAAALQQDYQYVSYGSKVRDLALAIFWMLEAERPAEYWIELLDSLQTALADRRWLSTQERNALFLAGQALVLRENNRWGWTCSWQVNHFSCRLNRVMPVLYRRSWRCNRCR